MKLHIRATGCHLSYGITRCYLSSDTSEHTPLLCFGCYRSCDDVSPVVNGMHVFGISKGFIQRQRDRQRDRQIDRETRGGEWERFEYKLHQRFETKGRSWWIDDLNVVRICVKLLHSLADWLTDASCPHYFINNSNFL